MTLPYIWYRSSVWILLCRAVNSFWGFLVIFWRAPVIEELAPGSSKLDLPLERRLSCFIIFKNLSYMSDSSQDANDFSVHLIPFFFFFFDSFLFSPPSATPQSPAHTSETSAERLALACERVHADNAMHYVFTAFVWNAAAVILASL